MLFLVKFIKKIEIKKKAYGCKRYFVNLCINSSLLGIGSLIGYKIELIFISLFSQNSSKIIKSLREEEILNSKNF